MDRTVVFSLSAPISRGHRIEVTQTHDESGSASIAAIVDIDAGVRFERSDAPTGQTSRWMGTVVACTVTGSASRVRTTLVVDAVRPGTAESDAALREADAAADAARDEALRWGGTDREPEPETPRFW
ncbi:hypothetical protein [Microbacterium sp.]|uniref:hypothetical protein n=1 Tax=Microbacterium sp. TaxID=51671 RepID=UPI002625AE11|nr:hypothetical protein [Microbacterium sp.]